MAVGMPEFVENPENRCPVILLLDTSGSMSDQPIQDRGNFVKWKAVARYEIGTSHQKQEIDCQDYGDYRIFDDVIVGAVADGAGSAKHSDFGSRLAVETVLKCFSEINEFPRVIIYQLLFGGQTLFAGKWIGAGETPETNEFIRQGLWLYAPNSLIQPVERTIPLEIIHPEVQRCFLRCFNDGYKNSNLRPTAGDWVKALRLAVNELTICGKVDSHYYSRTYGRNI